MAKREQRKNRFPGVYPYITTTGVRKWGVVYDAGDRWNRRQKRKRGFATQTDALAWRTDTLAKQRRGELVEPSKLPIADYFDEWIAAKARRVRPNTVAGYRYAFSLVAPAIGRVPLAKLSATMLDRAYDDLSDRYAPSLVRQVHTIVTMVCKSAVRDDLIVRNPCDRVEPPGAQAPPRRAWSPEMARCFLAHTGGDPLRDAWQLMLDCWLRSGEVRALRWRDLDLTTGAVTVAQTATRTSTGLATVGPPKTEHSARRIPLSDDLVARFGRRRRAQLEAAIGSGEGWSDDRLVFPTATGRMMSSTALGVALKAACELADVPYITPHGLRHTGGSLAHGAGTPIAPIAKRLGHKNAGITWQVYLHDNEDQQRELTATMAELLAETEPKPEAM